MIKKISIFNHKGGVSKTTTAFNLGWMLARKGKKVLLVDADSQCNLTLCCVGQYEYEKHFEQGDINNIKDALEPAFKAKPKLIDTVKCINVRKNPNLFLLPGHLDLTEYEVSLGVSFQLSNALGTLKNLPGAINYLIEKTAEHYGAEYIIIDLNPSLSAINQDIFVSSDYFLVPTSPDLFSYMAVKSLARILPSWEKWAKSARPLFEDAEYPLPHNTPKFLGYTINDFRNLLFMCAFTACEHNKSCREIYQRIIAKGKSKKLALIAVANKLLKQSLAIAKSGLYYDEEYRSVYVNLG